MKQWLEEKEIEQKGLLKELLDMSMQTLETFNQAENKAVAFKVIFSKDDWIDGKAKLEILSLGEEEGEYEVIEEYEHSVYNKNRDLNYRSDLFKLMSNGLFSNNWFAILDSSRRYDTTIFLTDSSYSFENESCEYREKRMMETHFGFNITIPVKNKPR